MSEHTPDIPDRLDSFFGGLVDSNISGWYQQETGEYFRDFPVSETDTVVDVGCGDGEATLFCAKRGARVIYTDVVPEVVAELGKKLQALEGIQECQGLVCNSNPLSLPDECATRVICSEVLEHVDDPVRVVSELARIGKPRALYLLTVPGAEGEYLQQKYAPKEYFEKPNHIRIFEESDFRSLVEEAGLEILRLDRSGFYWVMWWSLYWAARGKNTAPVRAGQTPNKVQPAMDDILDRWASIWVKFISTPEGLAFKEGMDQMLPKNQIIVARKPG